MPNPISIVEWFNRLNFDPIFRVSVAQKILRDQPSCTDIDKTTALFPIKGDPIKIRQFLQRVLKSEDAIQYAKVMASIKTDMICHPNNSHDYLISQDVDIAHQANDWFTGGEFAEFSYRLDNMPEHMVRVAWNALKQKERYGHLMPFAEMPLCESLAGIKEDKVEDFFCKLLLEFGSSLLKELILKYPLSSYINDDGEIENLPEDLKPFKNDFIFRNAVRNFNRAKETTKLIWFRTDGFASAQSSTTYPWWHTVHLGRMTA